MLTLACVVHAHWCFHGNGGAAWAVEREGQRRAAFHRASTQTEKHTHQIPPKQDYNDSESSLFTHTFTLLCILNKLRYILPQSTDVLSFLHNSAIWIWWGSAPRAPNVETSLSACLKVSTVSAILRYSGRVFQRLGAYKLKAASPCLFVLAFGTVRSSVPEHLRDLLCVYLESMSVIYSGA